MDSTIAIIGAAFAATFVSPFVYAYNVKSKYKKSLLIKLQTKANLINCKLTKHELLGDFLIGLDETKNVAFFLTVTKEGDVFQSVNLNEMCACYAINSSKTVKSKNGNYQNIEKLALSFSPKDKTQRTVEFVFYQAHLGSFLSGELLALETWSDIIKTRMSKLA